jgi:O-antigen biosynthesis protein WbqP
MTELILNGIRKEKGVFSMKPGLTGLAQVSGRDDLTYEQKASLDAEYVDKCSFALDVWCIYKTIIVVLTGEGAR